VVFIPECEICGREVERLTKIEIEGSIVEVCDRCVSYGKIVEEPVPRQQPSRSLPKPSDVETELVLVEGYGKKIKEAREKLGLSRKEFASKIGEKEGVVKKVEEEKMEPDEKLARKIEKFLKIKLYEKVPIVSGKKREEKKHELTIGDVVVVRTK